MANSLNKITDSSIKDDTITEVKLDVSNAASDGQFLQYKDSTDKLTWATVSTTDATKMPLAGGTFTGDVTFDNQVNAGRDITWDESDDALEFADSTKAVFGTGGDFTIEHNGSSTVLDSVGNQALIVRAGTGDLYLQSDGTVYIGDDGGNEYSAKFVDNGAVSLYYDNEERIKTTNLGTQIYRSGEVFNFIERTGTGADNNWLGCHVFKGMNDASESTEFVKILSASVDVSDGSEDGKLLLQTMKNGSMQTSISLEDAGAHFYQDGNKVFQTTSTGLLIGGTDQEPGRGDTNIGSSYKGDGRLFLNSSGSFSSFGRNDTGVIVAFVRAGGDQGNISVAVGSTTYNSGSDYRKKENDVVISDGITKLKQLRPIRFNWKEDSSKTKVDGFFAHEVQAVVPEIVSGTKDAVITQADIDNGDYKQSQKDDPKYQSMDYSKLTPLLTAALQEAIAKIETLETKVAALESA